MRSNALQSRWFRRLALSVIALGTFWIHSTLLFALLGLAPSSPRWGLALLLGGLWAIAGVGIALQGSPLPLGLQRLLGSASGAASGTVLGFYGLGRLMGQQPSWAIAGALVGGVALGTLAAWAFDPGAAGSSGAGERSTRRRQFWQLALGLVGCGAAYGLAFGLGAWTWAAGQAGRWLLGLGLGLLTGLALVMTRRSLHWLGGQPPPPR